MSTGAYGADFFGDSPQASIDGASGLGGGGGFAGRGGFSGSTMTQLAALTPAVAGTGIGTGYGSDSFSQPQDYAYSDSGSSVVPSYGTGALSGPGIDVASGVNSYPNYGGGAVQPGHAGGIAGGLLGNFTKGGSSLSGIKGLFYNSSGNIQISSGVAGSGAGIAAKLGGGIVGNAAGGLAGFAASDAAGAIGGSLFLGGLQGHPSVPKSVSTVAGSTLIGANIGSKVPGVGEVGGAVTGFGVGLVADGLHRGGATGLVEDAAGGAIVGYQYGGLSEP